jgi:hypothetical protein
MMMEIEQGRNPEKLWERLRAPLPFTAIEWRQDGKPTTRDGRHYARFVCYVEAGTVRERLDEVTPGEWDLTLELLPSREIIGAEGRIMQTAADEAYAFKARLQVMGVIREDVGSGSSYKGAATDAFKRASVRFGVGHELYDMPQLWIEVDGDGKYAKPLEDPKIVAARKFGLGTPGAETSKPSRATEGPPSAEERSGFNGEGGTPSRDDPDGIVCPKCNGRMWDNRAVKRNPKAPDYKCKDRDCDGVIWPKRADEQVDALVGQGQAHGTEPTIPGDSTIGGVSTTKTIKKPPPDNGKRLPGETEADMAGQPKKEPAPPRSTPPSQRNRPAALQDEDDDLPF